MDQASEKAALLRRLRRIEGQIRGVQKMIEEDRYCVDILTQLAAIRSATNAVGLAILERHIRGCVQNAIRQEQGDEMIEELLDVISSFIKSS